MVVGKGLPVIGSGIVLGTERVWPSILIVMASAGAGAGAGASVAAGGVAGFVSLFAVADILTFSGLNQLVPGS